MFARVLNTRLKPGKFSYATRTFQNEVIPLLKKQHGFKDEISFFNEDTNEGFAVSLWETEDDAAKYDREVYPKVWKYFESAMAGEPTLRTYEVGNSTWYNINA